MTCAEILRWQSAGHIVKEQHGAGCWHGRGGERPGPSQGMRRGRADRENALETSASTLRWEPLGSFKQRSNTVYFMLYRKDPVLKTLKGARVA